MRKWEKGLRDVRDIRDVRDECALDFGKTKSKKECGEDYFIKINT